MKNKKDRFYQSLIIIAIIVPIILGVSYAYFQTQIAGTDPGIVSSSASKFNISLETVNEGYISASDLLLIRPEEVDTEAQKGYFNVICGDNDNVIKYSISISELQLSANLKVTDFKWAIVNTQTSSTIGLGNFASATGDKHILISDIPINPNTTHFYELRLWLEETDAEQINLLNGTFSGKITLTSYLTDVLVNP